MKTIEFGLLDNGLDFLDSALEGLAGKPTARETKYATIHLSDGVELILKERLRRHNWQLLFSDPKKANDQDYKKGAFKSAFIDQVVDRLAEECSIDVPEEATDAFYALRDKRNRLEHFAISDSIPAIQAIAAKVVHHLLNFIDDELQPAGFTPEEERLLESLRGRLSGFDELVNERWGAIRAEVDGWKRGDVARWKGGPVVKCPACLEEALLIGDDHPRCSFCGYSDHPTAVANTFIEDIMGLSAYRTIKDGEDWPIYRCESCDSESMIHKEFDSYLCFSCGFEADALETCSSCGRPCHLDDMAVCQSCFNAAVARAKDD